jgi:hypothetical protein
MLSLHSLTMCRTELFADGQGCINLCDILRSPGITTLEVLSAYLYRKLLYLTALYICWHFLSTMCQELQKVKLSLRLISKALCHENGRVEL